MLRTDFLLDPPNPPERGNENGFCEGVFQGFMHSLNAIKTAIAVII